MVLALLGLDELAVQAALVGVLLLVVRERRVLRQVRGHVGHRPRDKAEAEEACAQGVEPIDAAEAAQRMAEHIPAPIPPPETCSREGRKREHYGRTCAADLLHAGEAIMAAAESGTLPPTPEAPEVDPAKRRCSSPPATTPRASPT